MVFVKEGDLMDEMKRFYINSVKGAAIFLMLWGHCMEYCSNGRFIPFAYPLFLGIYSFHMPLFMLVSGYLFFFSYRKRDLKQLLISRTQGMLQPILIGGVFYQFLMTVLYKCLDQEVSFLGGSLMPELFIFWFLWCNLACSISVSVSCKVTQNAFLRIGLLALGCGFMMLFPSGNLFLSMYPFFLIGFFFGMFRERLPAWFAGLRYVSLVLFPVLVSFYETNDSFYLTPVYDRYIGITASIQVNAYRLATGLAGSLFVMTLLWEAVRLVWGKQQFRLLLKPLAKMGENSLQIYCISTAVISGYLPVLYPMIDAAIGYDPFAGRMWLYDFVFTPLLALGYAAVIGIMIWCLKKLKVHSLIFGR